MAAALSNYQMLQAFDAKGLEQLMREYHITREMIDSNMTVDEWLRTTGQTQQLQYWREACQKHPRFAQRVKKYQQSGVGYIAPGITSQTFMEPRWEHAPRMYAMADTPDYAQRSKMYELLGEAYMALDAVINLYPVFKNVRTSAQLGNTLRSAGLIPKIIKHAVTKSDHTADAVQEGAGHVDDVVDLVSQAKSAAGDIASHGASDAATEVINSGLGTIFGFGLGYLIDHRAVKKTISEIKESYKKYCGSELEVAADYYKRNNDGQGTLKSSAEPLTDREKAAFKNLWEVMEFHGGCKLYGRKIIRDIGTISGIGGTLLGGPLGGITSGVAVLAVVKSMESGDGIPTLAQIDDKLDTINVGGGAATALLTVLFPPSLAVTVPAMIAINLAVKKIKDAVGEWHDKYGSDAARKQFLFEVGSDKEISCGTDEQVRIDLLANAERAAAAMKKGAGNHTVEDVRALTRYAAIAPYYYDKPCQEETFAMLQKRHQAMMTFIGSAKIVENKQAFINIARSYGLGR